MKHIEDMVRALRDYCACKSQVLLQEGEERYRNLDSLLQKSSAYASLLHKQMDLVKSREKVFETASSGGGRGRCRGRGRGRGRGGASGPPAKRRKVIESEDEDDTAAESKPNSDDKEMRFQQPELVTGGTLKD